MIAALAAVALLASVGTGVLVWQLSRDHARELPQISAYSNGQLVRVGPYRYCEVYNPTICDSPLTYGELRVNGRHTVQLSVPPAVSRALWIVGLQYEGGTAVREFRRNTTLAVTIPTVDPKRGRLYGIAVQLPTLIRQDGDEVPWVHAEWSIRTNWS